MAILFLPIGQLEPDRDAPRQAKGVINGVRTSQRRSIHKKSLNLFY